jgi:hypothetical protein
MDGAMPGSPPGRQVTLYLRSLPPLPSGEPRYVVPSSGLTTFVAGGLSGRFLRPTSKDRDYTMLDLPPDVAQCARLVLSVAAEHGYEVRVIDVATEHVPPDVSERLVTISEDYPVLVRADGKFLAGPASFTPAEVTRFLN